MSPETEMEHHRRRGRELNKMTKAAACALYRQLGGMGGIHPPEKWRKDEVITAITEMEWDRLPEDQKAPTPPLMCPPCDECGGGENARAHRYGGEHHYVNTWNPAVTWVRADHEPPAEEQPRGASATAAARPEVRAAVARGYEAEARGDKIGAMLAQTEAITHMVTPPRPAVLEGGTGPGVLADQTRERPDIIPPALAVVPSAHLDGCSADEDPDGETMCACESIARERAAYDPREEIECTPEMVDGHVIGCGDCEGCR